MQKSPQQLQQELLDAINAAIKRFEDATDNNVTLLNIVLIDRKRHVQLMAAQRRRVVLPNGRLPGAGAH